MLWLKWPWLCSPTTKTTSFIESNFYKNVLKIVYQNISWLSFFICWVFSETALFINWSVEPYKMIKLLKFWVSVEFYGQGFWNFSSVCFLILQNRDEKRANWKKITNCKWDTSVIFFYHYLHLKDFFFFFFYISVVSDMTIYIQCVVLLLLVLLFAVARFTQSFNLTK